MTQPRAFVLQRNEDLTGVSGTGIVAEGVAFSDGTVALRWTSEWPTSVVFHERGIDSVRHVHGHDGHTTTVWADGLGDFAAASRPNPPPFNPDRSLIGYIEEGQKSPHPPPPPRIPHGSELWNYTWLARHRAIRAYKMSIQPERH
jgi:hypothetical protein